MCRTAAGSGLGGGATLRGVPRFKNSHGRRPSIYREGEPTEGWGNPEGVPRSQTALRRFVFRRRSSYPPAQAFLSFKYVLRVLERKIAEKHIQINELRTCPVGNRRGPVCNRRYRVGNRRGPVCNRRAIHRLNAGTGPPPSITHRWRRIAPTWWPFCRQGSVYYTPQGMVTPARWPGRRGVAISMTRSAAGTA